MTCGQYEFPFRPLVDRYKWLEPRHMVNISDRWNRDKTSDLQFAFFNGVGWESWENILGIWNGITLRDAEALAGSPPSNARSPLFRKRGLAANGADTALRRLCQPLAARRTNVVYGREPERI
jgi:hypothetical protein